MAVLAHGSHQPWLHNRGQAAPALIASSFVFELAAGALVIFIYGLFSRVFERSVVSAPIFFTIVGVVLGPLVLGLFDQQRLDAGAVGILAEATLILVLYTDAIRIDIRRLRREAHLLARLLGIGLPLTLIAGAVVAKLMFDSFDWAAAFVLAAILTPTDAALGKPVVTDERVPVRVRQTINVESGLNDGIMLPIVTAAVAFLASTASSERPGGVGRLLLEQIGLGLLAGVLIGWVGGRLLDYAVSKGWVEGIMRQLTTLSIGVGAFAFAELISGNGFVAAFVAGLAFGAAAREHCEGAYNFATDEGELLTLLTFLVFGAIVVGQAVDQLTFEIAIYAVLSLTVIRMVPVAISLIGAKLKFQTVSFIGWFGPRGLASILFGVFLLEESGAGIADPIFAVVAWTVIFSIVAHGMTAVWLSGAYARWHQRHRAEHQAESMEMPSFPTR